MLDTSGAWTVAFHKVASLPFVPSLSEDSFLLLVIGILYAREGFVPKVQLSDA